jgi:aspartate carbamoyltransferase catalytic subunit|eukprot:COSAG06_NODE_6100_length_3109_cov_8.218272_5_plen_70_part_00
MLSLFSGVELLYCAPPDLQMPAEVEAFCTAKGVAKQSKFGEKGLEEVIKVADVVYMTRVQRERFATPPR